MGNGQSAVRASHFQNENAREGEAPDSEDDFSPNRISISNKMVERLVEDAAVAGGVAAISAPAKTEKPSDTKERIFAEKLQSLDNMHSEKFGLTIDNVKATANRVELRAVNLRKVEPVCQDCASRLIECYESCDRVTNAAKCAQEVTTFSKCVQESAVARCRARTAKDAIDAARRTRNVTQARHYALKDILPPQEVPS